MLLERARRILASDDEIIAPSPPPALLDAITDELLVIASGPRRTTAEAEEENRELKKQLQEAKGREDALLEVINRCRWGESAESGGNVLGRAMRASLLRWFEPAFTVAP